MHGCVHAVVTIVPGCVLAVTVFVLECECGKTLVAIASMQW